MNGDSRQTILIVDDAVENLDALDTMLRAEYRIQAARSGRLAHKLANAQPPDLILLDIVMPEVNGYAVCRELKANVVTRDIPVIFISALDDVLDKVEAFRSGGVDFITKPFHIEEVLARVRVHLTVHQLRSQLEERNRQLAESLAREKVKLTERIEAGLQAGRFAWWELELPSGHVVSDDKRAEMLGYSPSRFTTYADFAQLLHREDRDRAQQALQDYLGGLSERYEIEYRMQTSNGTYKWFREVGTTSEQDKRENHRRLIGIVEDITTRKRAEETLYHYVERLRAIRALDGAILAAETSEHIADVGLRFLQHVLPFCCGAVITLDLEGKRGALLALRTDFDTSCTAGMSFPLPDDPAELQTMQEQGACIVDDFSTATGLASISANFQTNGVRTYLAVPLEVKGTLIGILFLGARSPGMFLPEHIDVAREVADQLIVGMEQARMRAQLQQHAEALEYEVAERTRDLARRNTQLQVAVEVARDASSGRDLDDLMQRAVELVQERFGYYHTGLFLIDERREYAVLKASTSQEGRGMLAAGHRLRLGDTGLVSYAGSAGQPRIAQDTHADAQHYRNPHLPRTRSELALPLQVGERVIGVFDVQSTAAGAFDQEDVRILQLMADQLAVAIERTRLFAEVQATLKDRLEMVVSNAPVILFALDRQETFTLLEGKGLEVLGIDAGRAVGRFMGDVFPNQMEIQAHIGRVLDGETFTARTPIGEHVFESWYAPVRSAAGDVVGASGVHIDVTQRLEMEKQIHRQERLALVGQLAGGIAHDFNNFMTTIIMYGSLLMSTQRLAAEAQSYAQVIVSEAGRAAKLVRQVLDFSRRSIMAVEPVDLRAFIEETIELLRKTFPENIALAMETRPGEYVVNADPTRIQQILMNLALNARDAMPEGGQLRIVLSNVPRMTIDGVSSPLAADNWVRLSISDTGVGMTNEVRAHLYEPFFTTKGTYGTGLGLSQVYGIVEQHGGELNVETAPGQGTTFSIDFPAYRGSDEMAEQNGVHVMGLSKGHGETILLVEDDAEVRAAGLLALETLGYRTLSAPDGKEALRLYQAEERGGCIDLVLTDMIMPVMGGRELIQNLRRLNPAVKILILTGHAMQEDLATLCAGGAIDVIQKPIDIETLAAVVRRTLYHNS
jgi:PAS domain S-box-containing protein